MEPFLERARFERGYSLKKKGDDSFTSVEGGLLRQFLD